MTAQERLQAEIQKSIQNQLLYMLSDPGPWIHDVDFAAEDLAELVVTALCRVSYPDNFGGWLIQHSGAERTRARWIIESEMSDSDDQGRTWTVHTEREDEDDG